MAVKKIVLDGVTIIDLTTDTVSSANDIKAGKVGHLRDGTVVTGTYNNGTTPTGTISITENGTGIDVSDYATANVNVPSAAKPEQAKTATPTASAQTITPDSGYALSSVTISGDQNLIPGNIKSGVSIFGVAGTLIGSGSGGNGGGVESGTLTVSTLDTRIADIPHSLGATPRYVIWEVTTLPADADSLAITLAGCGFISSGFSVGRGHMAGGALSSYQSTSQSYMTTATSTTITFGCGNVNYKFQPGSVISWTAVL